MSKSEQAGSKLEQALATMREAGVDPEYARGYSDGYDDGFGDGQNLEEVKALVAYVERQHGGDLVPDRVTVDDVRGHIVVWGSAQQVRQGDPPVPPRPVSFADLGSSLHLDSGGAWLTPDVARALGVALIGWAVRKTGPGLHKSTGWESSDGMVRPACACGWGWAGVTTKTIAAKAWREHADKSVAIEAQWEQLVEKELRHYGYTEEQIAATKEEREHTEHCELTEFGWQCEDEDGKPQHPLHDEAEEVAGIIGRAMGWL